MSTSPEDQESFLIPDEERPVVVCTVRGSEVVMTWSNTLIRKFTINDGEFDYIFHRIAEKDGLVIMCNGSEDGRKLTEYLEEGLFPVQTNPVLGENDIENIANGRADYLEPSHFITEGHN